MATDATGTPTSPDNIPTLQVGVDAPTGNGENAMMAQIQAIITGLRVGTAPGGKITPSSALAATGTPSATTYLRGDNSWAAVSTGPGDPVTTLPASPSDGQQAILVDSTSTPTFSWLLQYSSSAAGWVFLGGMPLEASDLTGTARTISGASYATYTGAPSVTVPRAGSYVIQCGYTAGAAAGSNAGSSVSFSIGGAAANVNNAAKVIISVPSGNVNAAVSVVGPRSRNTGLAANTTIALQSRQENSSTIATVANSWLAVYPILVT